MAEPDRLPAPASRHALALLRFPDHRTDWVVVTVATLTEPIDGPEALDTLHGRLARLHDAVPIVGARLLNETWHAGSRPDVQDIDGDPLDHPAVDRPFDLASEAPLRLLLGAGAPGWR